MLNGSPNVMLIRDTIMPVLVCWDCKRDKTATSVLLMMCMCTLPTLILSRSGSYMLLWYFMFLKQSFSFVGVIFKGVNSTNTTKVTKFGNYVHLPLLMKVNVGQPISTLWMAFDD